MANGRGLGRLAFEELIGRKQVTGRLGNIAMCQKDLICKFKILASVS